MKQYNLFAWEDDFPPVYGNTSTSYLKQCPGFREAKLGNMRSALKVVYKCINTRTITEIKNTYPDATLLPVITNNKLPEALAVAIGMKTCTEVHELETLSRKSFSAMERLLHQPIFYGRIIKDQSYIIVDDIITQGGTVAALRKHVIANGGVVDAIVALSYSAGSKILVPSQTDILSLTNRFGLQVITNILRYYNVSNDLCELTRAQVLYLLQFKDIKCLISKIENTQKQLACLQPGCDVAQKRPVLYGNSENNLPLIRAIL